MGHILSPRRGCPRVLKFSMGYKVTRKARFEFTIIISKLLTEPGTLIQLILLLKSVFFTYDLFMDPL